MSNKKLPSVTSNIPRDLRTFIDRVRDLITGGTNSRLLSAQDLIDAGLAGGTGGSLSPLPPTQATVTPPTPTGLTATAAIRNIIVEWDPPTYPGHAYAEIWGSSTDSLGTAVKLGMSPGSLFVDSIGPGASRYYWVRFVNIEDVAGPYNGVSGTFAQTQQEPAYLLEVLTGEITESQLYADLNSRIDLIDGDASLAGSVNDRIALEAAARGVDITTLASAVTAEELVRASADIDLSAAQATLDAAISQEAINRTIADTAEEAARIAADVAEATTRAEQITIESRQRIKDVETTAYAVLESALATNTERLDRLADTASVKLEVTENLVAGLSAEASQRLELTAVVNQNAANIVVSQTALSTLDSSTASSLSTLVTQVNNNLAAIQNEVIARTDADSAEATTRDLLAVQLRGEYTGSDLGSLASGLLYQERVARVTEDASLAQQITLLSAGSGDQFDWKTIWYFDTGVESWTGNGTPTATAGWLRPANAASDAYVESPTNVGADGAQYGQVRMRIRKTGSPTFAGYLWWRASGDTTWDSARRVSLDEPTYDGNGIGLITANPGWSVLVDRVRIDLSSAQTATDYFELDWVAVGRPSPGASFAQLLLEQEARTSADDALSQQILTLDASLGDANAALVAEQQARVDADSSTASQTLTLQAAFGQNSALLSEEATVRADADTTFAAISQSLIADFQNASAAVLVESEARAEQDSALASQVTTLTSTVGDNTASLTVVQNTVADLESASATQTTKLFAIDKATQLALDDTADVLLRDIVAINAERKERQITFALAREDLTAAINDGIDAEASRRLELAAVVNDNYAQFVSEQVVRATADEALATSIDELTANVGANAAAISLEQTVRATADEATAQQVSTLTSGVADSIAAITAEQTARTTADEAAASQITTLSASVGDNAAAITNTQNILIDLDSVVASQTTSLIATNKEFQTAIDENSELSLRDLLATVAETNDRKATIAFAREDLTIAINEGISAEATKRLELAALVDDLETSTLAALTLEQTTRADVDGAISQQVLSLSSSLNDVAADLILEQTTRATADSAFSGQLTTLSTTVGENTAAIEQNIESIDGVRSQYTLKIDNNGFVSGFGLASELIDGGTASSEFYVNVDKFAVTAPASSIPNWTASTSYAVGRVVGISGNTTKMLVCKVAGTSGSSAPSIAEAIGSLVVDNTVTWQIASRVPFAVVTTESTINGVTVPPGLYVDGAMIVNATVQTAQIADLAVDDNKIADVSAGKITAGSIDVESYIQSTGFISGTEGWRIDGNGSAEFGAASIRGQLTAAQIDSRGLSIKDGSGNIILAAGTPLDYTNVGGTKPPSDADKTAANIAAGIANQGEFATLDQITSSNVSTYIASAAIGTAEIASASISSAKIQSAAVRTLEIAGNAVTIPQSLNYQYGVDLNLTIDSILSAITGSRQYVFKALSSSFITTAGYANSVETTTPIYVSAVAQTGEFYQFDSTVMRVRLYRLEYNLSGTLLTTYTQDSTTKELNITSNGENLFYVDLSPNYLYITPGGYDNFVGSRTFAWTDTTTKPTSRQLFYFIGFFPLTSGLNASIRSLTSFCIGTKR